MGDRLDVIVIGAGMGGLSAAIKLAAAGLRVRVYEAEDAPGGKLGAEVIDGVEFDTGPSLLTMSSVLSDVLAAAGATLEEELELVRLDPAFRYVWPDGAELEVRHELSDTLASVRASLGAKAEAEYAAFMAYSKEIWESARPNFIDGAAPDLKRVVKLSLTRLPALMRIDPLRTMAQGIGRHVQDRHLLDVFWRYATYNGSDPRSAPATLNCIPWVEQGLGAWGVSGGMKSIPRALERVGERLGVEYVYGARVARIDVERGRTRAVALEDGQVVRADAIVANADVAHVIADLLPRRSARALSTGGEPSMSGWNAIMRADASRERAPHTVLFPERYVEEFEDIFDHGRPPREPTVYMCAQSRSHGRAGWEDGEPVFVMANAPCEPARGETAQAVWDDLEARVLGRLERAGLRRADEELVWTRTPTDLARRFVGSRGSIYGAASNSQLSAFKRPPNAVASIPGLYLASGSAHPGGGVPLCLMSGQTAASALLRDRGA